MQTPLSPAATSFLQRLRAETDPMHRQLEQSPLSSSLMHPDITIGDYSKYLSYMRNVIAWCETTVFPVAGAVVPVEGRHKLQLIDNDLSFLNHPPFAEPFHSSCDMANTASALGCMYVIEGSTLGGRIILKHISARLPVNENKGASFFYGYGDETGRQWGSFLQQFTQYITDIHAEDQAIEAGMCTFSSIDKYFRL